MLAQAVIDRRISLDDDVRRYLPNGSEFTNLSYQGAPIRIVHLANHTSGIPNQIFTFPANWDTITADERYRFKVTLDAPAFLTALRQAKIASMPGTQYVYSGSAVRLLALILEQVYGKPYTTLFRDYVVGRLGMSHTRIISTTRDWVGFAFGDQDPAEVIRTRSGFDDLTAAAGGVSTMADLVKYLKYNIAETDPAVALAHRQTWEGGGRWLGLVWRREIDDLQRPRLFHTGRGLGNQCLIMFYPSTQTGLAIFTNDVLPDSFLDELARKVMRDLPLR